MSLSIRLCLLLVMLGGVISCSSSPSRQDYDMIVVDRKSDRQVNVEFDGRCAMAVANGKLNIPGDKRYMLQHGGKTYYFASEDAKERFEQNLDANIDRAQDNWAQAHAGI
jgi:YHS domain-containing protein